MNGVAELHHGGRGARGGGKIETDDIGLPGQHGDGLAGGPDGAAGWRAQGTRRPNHAAGQIPAIGVQSESPIDDHVVQAAGAAAHGWRTSIKDGVKPSGGWGTRAISTGRPLSGVTRFK